MVAMSTSAGQSFLQPLQARHRSSASRTSVDRQPAVTGESACPSSISNSSRLRPRVEFSSSRVTMYDGHITPPLPWRHLPTPTHRITARSNRPSSSGYAKYES